jgi:hypothetical protein
MHSTKVTNFTKPSSGKAFATVTVKLGGELGLTNQHITTSMSTHGNEVTIFFDSTAEIRQFATDLLVQASTGEPKCQT